MFSLRCAGVILASCFLSLSWADDLELRDAWIREAPPVAKSHGAYMELVNHSEKKVVIVSVIADDYRMTMLHKTVVTNGMATMEHVDALAIASQETVKLEPGGLHIMLMGPKRTLKAGDSVNIILVLGDGRRLEVSAAVRAAP